MADTPSRIHKSLRLEAGLADRVSALRASGESEAAAFARVIEAGVEVLEARPLEDDGDQDAQQSDAALVAALESHVSTLKEQLDAMARQLEKKDAQIETLARLTEQAQTLHALETAKALEAPKPDAAVDDVVAEEERPSLWARLKSFIG